MDPLSEKILSGKARIGVVGLGYVGLPLVIEFAKKGFSVMGFDVDAQRVESVKQGASYISDVPNSELQRWVSQGKMRATVDFDQLKDLDIIVVCVPTPLRKSREPDLSYVLSAVEQIQLRMKKGQLIVLESTTYPGTTEEMVLPMLTRQGLKVGEDFCLGYSPERMDPGNKDYKIHNTPKVVSGVTGKCRELTSLFYAQIVERVVPVSSPRVAELVKLLENTFRAVNIGLINEMAMICDKLGVETGEVIQAASTKPFGFMTFMPGPGLGGHCIPVDPQYLSWKLKSLKYHPRFIQLADEINTAMPSYIVSKIGAALNQEGKPLKGAKVLVLGVSYKRDVGDLRESPALDVMEELMGFGATVQYSDPHVPQVQVKQKELFSVPLTSDGISQWDCVVLLTDHTSFDYELIAHHSRLLVDTRNATPMKKLTGKKIIRL